MAEASLAYLAQVKNEIKANVLDPTRAPVIESDDYLANIALPMISARIVQYCQQEFLPLKESRYFDATQQTIAWYKNQLLLDRPLLESELVKVADVELTQWDGVLYSDKFNSDYVLYPINRPPALALQGLQLGQTWNPVQYGVTPSSAGFYAGVIQVTGTWGFRRNYATQAWMSTGDTVQDDPLSDSATVITVNDVDGALPDGSSPRFSKCQLIRIHGLIEDEWCEVVDTDATAHTITVIRGARGSIATEHAQNSAIDLFVPEPNITRAAIRWAAYLLNRRTVFENAQVNAQNNYVEVMPQDMPDEVRGLLFSFRNVQSGRV